VAAARQNQDDRHDGNQDEDAHAAAETPDQSRRRTPALLDSFSPRSSFDVIVVVALVAVVVTLPGAPSSRPLFLDHFNRLPLDLLMSGENRRALWTPNTAS